jgi:DNA-binding response OmpR family regulator
MNTARRVLIVDDDPDVLALLALNFDAEGFDVLTCTSGADAEAVALSALPDLILLDVMMPERDGLEVLRALKATARTRDIPVVLLTARSTDADIWEGWRSGTDYYMTKPFDLDELLRFADHVTNHRGLPSEGSPSRR